MPEIVVAILLTYQTKCGIQYKTEIHEGFKTTQECIKFGETQYAMYMRANKTNVLAFEYTCYKRN